MAHFKRYHIHLNLNHMNRFNISIISRALCSLYIGLIIHNHGVQGATVNEKSKAFASDGARNRGAARSYNDTTFVHNTTTRYVPPPQLNTPNALCKLCNYTWSVPYPQHVVRGQTCSNWNNKFKLDNCLMYQGTYGAVCGCTPAPSPPCPVCDGYGEYIWTLSTSSRANYLVDQCIGMVLDLSKDSRVCSSYRQFVAKLCCTHPPVSDDTSSTTDRLRTDDHYVSYGDDYSYAGAVYDDQYIRFDDYYLGHGKGAKKGPKHVPHKKGKKNVKKLKKAKKNNYHDDHILYPKSKSKMNPYHHDDHIYPVPYRYY